MAAARTKTRVALFLVLIAMSLASYAGAYFVMQRTALTGTNGEGVFTVRYYSADWHVVLFQPAAAVESVIRGRDIQVAYIP
jgi:hypothetical protein